MDVLICFFDQDGDKVGEDILKLDTIFFNIYGFWSRKNCFTNGEVVMTFDFFAILAQKMM